MELKSIVISRTDSIGDVVLTLPLAGWLKKEFPGVRITFLGAEYTRDVVKACVHVDEFASWPDEKQALSGKDMILHVFPRKEIALFAKKMKIPYRLGTSHRSYHWYSCNKLVAFSRKRSDLHEAQLNFKLLEGLTRKPVPGLGEISGLYGLADLAPLREDLAAQIDKTRFNLILHPKSKGSAREWGLEHFAELAKIIPGNRVKVFITGTEAEGEMIRESGLFRGLPVTDLTGQMTLAELMGFIKASDGLIAASTGPLHLAAALGKHAIGLYPPIRPMHPGRWAPVGVNASFLVIDKSCSDCRKSLDCQCMRQISPEQVLEKLMQHLH